MTSLVMRPEGLLFNELKRLCALTDGNLSRHLDVLKEAGLVEVVERVRQPASADALPSLSGRTRSDSWRISKSSSTSFATRCQRPHAAPSVSPICLPDFNLPRGWSALRASLAAQGCRLK